MVKPGSPCPKCRTGFVSLSLSSSYYVCNGCYKYIGDVEEEGEHESGHLFFVPDEVQKYIDELFGEDPDLN